MFSIPKRLMKTKNISVTAQFLVRGAAVAGFVAGLSTGAHAQTAPSHPAAQTSVLQLYGKSYGKWVYECVRVMPSGAPSAIKCFINQKIDVTQNGQQLPWMTIMMAKATGRPDDLVNVVVPLGIMLPPGIDLWSDKNTPVPLPVNFCTSNGCVVTPQPADALEKQLKDGEDGHARLTLVDGQTVTANFALTGFGAALSALNSGTLPPEIDMSTGAAKQKSSGT
jgi:invasion protein IalB